MFDCAETNPSRAMEIIRERKVVRLNFKLKKFKFLFLFNCFLSYLYELYKYLVHKLRKKFINYEIPYDLTGFQCVITGGAGEIGTAIVKKMLRKNCRVLIATIPNKPDQTLSELEAQLEKVLKRFRRELWEVSYLDLSSFKSINEFVDNFKKSNRTIDILINNAAVFLVPFGITADGFERHLQTNFLGHSLLILNLLPVLRPSESSLRTRKLLNLSLRSKVINLTSCVHRWVTPDLKLLNRATPEDEENYSIYYAYSYSKLLIIAFNFYLVKNILPKLNSNIRSVQIHPGGVASSMVIQSPINNILPVVKYESLFRNTFLWPPEQAAEHVLFGLFGIFAEEFENEKEVYLESFEQVRPNSYCSDEDFQAKVYQRTVDLLKEHLHDSNLVNL